MPKQYHYYTYPELQRLVDSGEAWRGDRWLSEYVAALIVVGKLHTRRD